MRIKSLVSIAAVLSLLVATGCGSNKSGDGSGGSDEACKAARSTVSSGWEALGTKVTARKTEVLDESRAQTDAQDAVAAAATAWRGAGDATAAQQAAVAKVEAYVKACEKTDVSRKQLLELAKGESDKGTKDPAIQAQNAENAKAFEAGTADLAAMRAQATGLATTATAAAAACKK